jgi:DNA-damage-inducible protein J
MMVFQPDRRQQIVSNVTIQLQVSPELKQQAEAVFAALGLSTPAAIRMFLQQSVSVGGLPFQPVAKRPNKETLAAMEELENGGGQVFGAVAELVADWRN